MSANPLQGIQVINSVNPCSSTPLHRPIYPYHYRGFPVLPRPHRPCSPPALPSLAQFSSLHLPHPLTWNLDSPLPGSTHPPLRLQEKVENCDYKDFPGIPSPPAPPSSPPPVSPHFLLTSSLLSSITVSYSFRRLIFFPLPVPSSRPPFLSSFLSPSVVALFRSFLYFSFSPALSRFFPPVVSRSFSFLVCAWRAPSRIKTLTLCYPFSQRREGVKNRDVRKKMEMSEVRRSHERERERDRPAIVIQGFHYVGQISVGRISPLIKRPILHFAPPRPEWRSLFAITNK